MYLFNPETIDQRSISITKDPVAFEGAVDFFSVPGDRLMKERSANSSVPPYLGLLIESVRKEVGRQFSQMSTPASGKSMIIGDILIGGSNYRKTVWEETAYRVFGHDEFYNELLSKYALMYAAGTANVKQDGGTENTYSYSGFVLLTEKLAKAPDDPFDRPRHFYLTSSYHYPTSNTLYGVRISVDRHFDDVSNKNRVFYEAQRLGALPRPIV